MRVPSPRASWSRRVVVRAVAGVALIAAGATGLPAHSEPAPSPIAASGPAVSGARMSSLHPEYLDAFAGWRSNPVGLAHEYLPYGTWADIEGGASTFTSVWAESRYQTRMMYSVGLLPADSSTTLAEGATGAYDDHFRVLAQRLVDAGMGNAVVRLGWEMNGSWYRWSAGADPTSFVAYWRHIVEAMRAVPGAAFSFVWCVTNGRSGAADYPGDDVVDYIAGAAYDASWVTGYTDPLVRWDDIANGKYGLEYWAGFAGAHGKRFALPEWGVWTRDDGHGGGDDPFYVDSMRSWIDTHDVAFEAYFNRHAADGDHYLGPDATVFPLSAARYQAGWSSPLPVPTGVAAVAVDPTDVDVTWLPADGSRVTGYVVYRDGVRLDSVTAPPYRDSGLADNTTHDYAVTSVDELGLESAPSDVASATTPLSPDVTPPSAPGAVSASSPRIGQVVVAWQSSSDDRSVAAYHVVRDGVTVATAAPDETTYTDGTVTPGGTYSYSIEAVDGAGNVSESSSSAVVTVLTDVTPPAAPATLSVIAASSGSLSLSWSAASDDVGVAGYRLYRDGALVTTQPGTAFTDRSVTPLSSYTYAVRAYDAAGNTSTAVSTTARTPAASGQSVTFAPTDDSYVSKSAAKGNYGAAANLTAGNKPVTSTLLKFTVATNGCRIGSAKLRLVVNDASAAGGDVYRTGTGWVESTVSWSTAPATTGGKLASVGKVTNGGVVTATVSGAVTTDGVVAFRITSTSNDTVGYVSKEAGSGNGPQLTVTCL